MPDKAELTGGTVHYWMGKIAKEEKAHEKFRKAAKEAEGVYFDCADGQPEQVFNLFYSTVQTLQARLFSRAPAPDVRRRFDASQNDPQAQAFAKSAKDAALIMERALSYVIDTTPFYTNGELMVQDYLTAGLGVPCVSYDTEVSKDAEGNPVEILSQGLSLKHKPWSRFHWEPGKCWEDVDWAGYDDYLTKDELKRQFGREPDADGTSKPDKSSATSAEKFGQTYRVTTIYYRPTRTVYVIGWDFQEPLREYRDELNLSGFYPFPRPMFANVKSNDLTPTPDYWFNRKSYAYINRLVTRIQMLTASIKDVGFYDASVGELASLSNAADGDLVPIQNLAQRLLGLGSADFSKVIAKLPILDQVNVTRELQGLLLAEKARLDEANGIADIVRGSTDPNETASAQRIKSNWASLRLAKKQGEISRTFRDCFRIMAEIISEHFMPESIQLMTGIMPTAEVMAIIQSDIGRTLAIDVETDSTVAIEDEAEKAQRLEFLNYVTPFIKDVLPAVQQGLLPGDVAKELLKFALSSFKHGRNLEDAIEAAPGTMQQLAQFQQNLQQAGMQIQQLGAQLQQAQAVNAQAEQAKAVEGITKAQATQASAQASQASSAASIAATQQKAANDQVRNEIDAFTAQTDRIAVMQPGTTTVNVQ